MSIDDAISASCTAIAAVFGEAVTHTDADGAETEIDDATFSEQPPRTIEGPDGLVTLRRATCSIAAADVAAPAIGETITRAQTSETWTIESEPLAIADSTWWQLALKRITAHEKTRSGHRLAR